MGKVIYFPTLPESLQEYLSIRSSEELEAWKKKYPCALQTDTQKKEEKPRP